MSQGPNRLRGVVLTQQGLERLGGAIASAQAIEKDGKRFTQAELSDRTGLSIKTIKKVCAGSTPVDEASVQLFFKAFGLQLETADYGQLEPNTREPLYSETPNSNDQNGFAAAQNTSLLTHESYSSSADRDSLKRQFKLPRGVPYQVPPLPYYFVERPEHQNAVKKILLEDKTNQPGTLVVSAIYGLGGIGKSVLAMKLAHDPEILDRYGDGVLWATLGQQPDILTFLSHWIQALGDHSYQPITVSAASAHLRTLLADKRMLLVVDDVWHPEHAEAFRVGSSDCCVLITTREARIPQARRYPLDVMSPEQSLELITHKLSTPLNKVEQHQALAFAERIGFLPLALELTASQIEEGVTWTELFDDFQAEVAGLETLDLYSPDDISDDTKRRNYSLTACFQLSLKLLSPEQLSQFAWLGVVPEDVTLTPGMAMTLWQVPRRVAGAILRTFTAKALLLPGGEQLRQRATYRMHDLMHDLAQKLLTSPNQPCHEGNLPGLGLTRTEAHSVLINHYRQKTDNGQWHTLPDDGYIHAYLTWHMEKAEQFDQIHQLLQEETPTGRNAWYSTCVDLGQTANFVTDVARAWRLANELYKDSPAHAISLQCRYALIKASLNSLVENFQPELIGVLVQTGKWSPAQGLAHIQQISHPWQKWKSFKEIIPYLPDSLLEEAYQISKDIQDKDCQALVVVYLSSRMPDLEKTAEDITENISDPSIKTIAYRGLASRDSRFWIKAIESLSIIQEEEFLAYQLGKLIADVPDSSLPEMLAIANEIRDVHNLAVVMGAIVLRAPDRKHEANKILQRVKEIEDIYYRLTALGALAPVFPEIWPETLALIKRIKHERGQANILIDLAPQIPEDLLDEVVNIAQSFESASNKAITLGILAKRRSYLWEEALGATKITEDKGLQISVISNFALKVRSLLPTVYEETQQANRSFDRALALSSLASHDPSLWEEALKSIRNIRDVYDRARAFVAVAPEMPELWPEALKAVQAIQGAIYQVWVLEDLAPLMPELWPATMDAIGRIWVERQKSDYLYRLSDTVPDSQISTAVDIAATIQEKSERALALSAFSNRDFAVSRDLEILLDSLSFQNNKEYYSALVLAGCTRDSPENWQKVIDIILNLNTEQQKALALGDIALKIPETLVKKALEINFDIKSDFFKAIGLFALLPRVDTTSLSYSRWCEVISTLSSRSRGALLKRMPMLTTAILKLGGEDAVIETANAILEVGRQW